MRAKPEMKPWVHTGKSRMSSAGVELQREHLPYVSEVSPLKGLNKYTDNNKPRACALGYAGVSPRWGSSITTARNEYDVLTKVSTR